MKDIIEVFKWRPELGNIENIDSIGDDFILLDKPVISSMFEHPFKADVVTAIIVIKGNTKGKINLTPYHTEGPSFIIILPDQILEYEHISKDFSGLFIIMSRRFTESLNIEERFSVFISIRNNPCISLNKEALDAMITYYQMMQRAIRLKDNPSHIEIAKHLTKAFFYGAGYYFHDLDNENTKSKNEIFVDNFLQLVQTNFKKHRDIKFYADKLCLTPKYMSAIIKENSGKSANEWINDYIILEAKALLKSTNMNIQQISDELNFSNQSFFGKYFKRLVGLSPKEYKNKENLT